MPPTNPCEPDCMLFVSANSSVEIPSPPEGFSDASIQVTLASKTIRTAEVGKMMGGQTYELIDTEGALYVPGDPVKAAVLTYSLDGRTVATAEEILIIQ